MKKLVSINLASLFLTVFIGFASADTYYADVFEFVRTEKLGWNNMAGLNRGYYRPTYGWTSPYHWNKSEHLGVESKIYEPGKPEDNWLPPQTPYASYTLQQYNILQNRWERSIDGYIFDYSVYAGYTKIEPFDPSMGALNSVTVDLNVKLDTWLTLSLLDDRFLFYNAEGQGTGLTQLLGYIGHEDVYRGLKEDIFLELSSDTGWQTAWAGGFGSLSESLESGAWGGAPSIFDALTCLIYPQECVYTAPDWSEEWSKIKTDTISTSVILSDDEYFSLLGPKDYFPILTNKVDYHGFWYEAGDVYDESVYTSAANINISIAYDYSPAGPSPVHEPATLLLLSTGLIGIARLRARRKSRG